MLGWSYCLARRTETSLIDENLSSNRLSYGAQIKWERLRKDITDYSTIIIQIQAPHVSAMRRFVVLRYTDQSDEALYGGRWRVTSHYVDR